MLKRLFLYFVITLVSHSVFAISENGNVPLEEFPIGLQIAIMTGSQPYWKKGYLDVTRAPYYAKGDGVNDDTQAIQSALDDAYVSSLVVFFPGDKIYLVSGQLRCVEEEVSRKAGYQMVGSVKGTKPVIKLKDNSNVTDGLLIRFALLMGGNENDENAPSCYNHYFRGIDIDMGDNPNVSAISMNGNQYNVIEDVKIYGTDFYAGVNAIPGCGGGIVNLTVTGGRYGIYQDEFRPEPTIFGLHLKGQTECGIYLTNSRGPVTIAGFKIESPDNPMPWYRAVYAENTGKKISYLGIVDHGAGNLVLLDGTISVNSNDGYAIENIAQDLSINNVYIKARTLLTSGDDNVTGGVKVHDGSTTEWSHITKYRFTSSLDKGTSFVNGVNQNDRTEDFEVLEPIETSGSSPSENFLTMHSWTSYLTWEDDNMVDIVEDFGATPDTETNWDDDTPAIQAAIDAVSEPESEDYGKTVFIPRGWFHITETIVLKDNVKILGSSRLNSCITPLRYAWYKEYGPMIKTEDSTIGNIYLEEFGIVGNPVTAHARFTSPNLTIKDIGTERAGNRDEVEEPSEPYYEFSGNVGGKVYHFCLGAVPEKLRYGDPPKPGYHSILVENNKNPLSFYQLNVAHLTSSPQVLFQDAQNITIRGFKYEFEHELLHIINSDNIHMYGGTGNYQLWREEDQAIVVIKNSTNIEIQNFNRREDSVDPTTINTKWILFDDGVDETIITGDYAVLHFEVSDPATSVEPENLAQNGIDIYPNPFNDNFKVHFTGSDDLDGVELKVYSMLGQLIHQQVLTNVITNVNTGSWTQNGVYLVQITDKNGVELEKNKLIKYSN